MDTMEIRQILRMNKHTKSIFLDVYAVDQLPKKKITQDRWLMVVNCCPINRQGEHWVCIFGDKNTGIDFFDSFGLSPVKYDKKITRFFHDQGYPETGVKFNATLLQDLDTDACGHYCILFGRQRALGKSMSSIVELFSRLTRDTIVKYLVNTGFDLDRFIYEIFYLFEFSAR